MFNKFNTESFVVVQKAYSEPLAEDGTLTFTIDSAPISAPSERELKTYQLIG
jgi:hypothetical protein